MKQCKLIKELIDFRLAIIISISFLFIYLLYSNNIDVPNQFVFVFVAILFLDCISINVYLRSLDLLSKVRKEGKPLKPYIVFFVISLLPSVLIGLVFYVIYLLNVLRLPIIIYMAILPLSLVVNLVLGLIVISFSGLIDNISLSEQTTK